MPRNPLLPCSFALAGLLVAAPAFAQSAPGEAKMRIGVGVSLSGIGELRQFDSDEMSEATTVPTILVPIDLAPWLRIEPEVGFFRTRFDAVYIEGSESGSDRHTHSGFRVGTGAFAVATKDRFKLYYGGRLAYLRHAQSYRYDGESNSYTLPGWLVAPALGGEYAFSSYVSLGGEVQVSYTWWSLDDSHMHGDTLFTERVTGNALGTHGAVMLRFYFSPR